MEIHTMYKQLTRALPRRSVYVIEDSHLDVAGKATWRGTEVFETYSARVPKSIKHLLLIHPELGEVCKFSTLLHEISHVFAGHLRKTLWPFRWGWGEELEAELATYVVARRLDVQTHEVAARYLAQEARYARLTRDRIARIGLAAAKITDICRGH